MSATLTEVFALIDAANAQDPNLTSVNGQPVANELLYGQRMSACLKQFAPDAPELLQIAVRAQHIQRWKIPRNTYPMDRAGYKKWRADLAVFHGEQTAAIMKACGYSAEDQARVKDILQKKRLKKDTDVQTLEDVACLVFVQFYLADFARKHDDDKLIDIIRKTWNKMSPAGQQAALNLDLPLPMLSLVQQALSPTT